MRADPFGQGDSLLTGQEPSRFVPDFQLEKTEDSFVFKANLLGIKDNEVDIAVAQGGRRQRRGPCRRS
jgi:hypothetical protein